MQCEIELNIEELGKIVKFQKSSFPKFSDVQSHLG